MLELTAVLMLQDRQGSQGLAAISQNPWSMKGLPCPADSVSALCHSTVSRMKQHQVDPLMMVLPSEPHHLHHHPNWILLLLPERTAVAAAEAQLHGINRL